MIRVDRSSLAAAASEAARMAASKAGVHDIWAQVHLVQKAGRLTLTAMDSANRIELSVDAQGDLEPVCINAARFAEVIASLPAETVEIDNEPGRLKIIGGRGKRSLAVDAVSDYPEADFTPNVEATISGGGLREALAFTLPHIAPAEDVTKRHMSGVHIASKGKQLRLIGTDAHEMGVFDLGHCAEAFSATLNPKMADFAMRGMPDGNILFRLSERQAEVSWAGNLIRGPLIDENFPIDPVEHALVKDYDRSAALVADNFLQAIRSIRPIGEVDSLSRSRRVKLTLNGTGMVSTQSGEGSAEQEFPADWSHDAQEIGFACARMERIIRHFGDSVITIGIRRDESAMRIEAQGQGDRLCLLFPLRL